MCRINLNVANESHAADMTSSVQKLTTRSGTTRYVSWTWMSSAKESGKTNLTTNASMMTNPAPIRCFIDVLRDPSTSGVSVLSSSHRSGAGYGQTVHLKSSENLTSPVTRRNQDLTARSVDYFPLSFHRYLRPPSVVPFSISSFWASPILMPLKPPSSSH